MTLEERQKEWDEKYDSPNSEPVKSRPARPSEESDVDTEKMGQFTNQFSRKLNPKFIDKVVQENKLRRTGRSTRIIDEAIQTLFNEKEVKVVDHHPGDQPNDLILHKTIMRLISEHGFIMGVHFTVEKGTRTITLK